MGAELGLRQKDPNAKLDYTVDWSDWLNGDTLATSTFVVASGLTKESETNNTTTATVWLSGGTNGDSYIITNRITTATGRTEDRSFVILVSDK